MSCFERALTFVLQWEGGYVNHPDDPGGATNQGITQRTYDAWRSRHGLVPRDVKQLDVMERSAIYTEDYWLPAGCADLRWPLCLIHFDTAVNLGVGRATRMLTAASRDADHYLFARRNYYIGLANKRPNLAAFLKGWLHRLDALEAASKRTAA